jgi:hypothetical protein
VVKGSFVTPRDAALAAGLALFLLAIYLFTFAGVLRSIDELSLFAGTENLVQAGSLQPVLVRFALYHNHVGPFEPGYSLLAIPFYVIARQWTGVSNLHTVMLLNPLLTALNAGLLYGLGRRLRYGEAASLSVALAFGLATMAWPYTKSFLREPAVALLWTAAFWGLAHFVEKPGWAVGALSVAAVVAAVGVKAASLASWPAVFVVLAWALHTTRRVHRRWLIAGGAIVLGLSAGLALFLFAQRGLGAAGLIDKFLANPFTLAGITPWYGLLASPGKSVFLYSPVILLGVIGWPAFRRRHSILAVGLLLLGLAVLASLRASDWWGGLTWGPRFLAPFLPLALLPALELFPHRKWAWGLAGLSAAYQALVSSAAWPVAYQALLAQDLAPDRTIGLDWMRWMESPVVQIVLRWGRSALDVIWLHPGLAQEMKLDLGLGVILTATVGATAAALVLIWRDRRSLQALAVSLIAVLIAVPVLLTRAYAALPDDAGLPADLARSLASGLSHDPLSPARIVNVSSDFGVYPWLGLLKGKAATIWISPVEEAGDFESLLPSAPGARLAVVVDRPHIASLYPGDRLVTWLNANTYRLESHWLEGYEIFHYATPGDAGTLAPAAWQWPNGIALTGWAAPASASRGTVLPIDLMLKCLTDQWSASDVLFTHLVAPSGTVISGQDGLPQYGNLAAAGWRVGQTALDRRGIWIPPDAAAGEYELIVGFANAQGFVRLTLPSGEVVDYATLTRITIASTP